jgi:hypothetical protein
MRQARRPRTGGALNADGQPIDHRILFGQDGLTAFPTSLQSYIETRMGLGASKMVLSTKKICCENSRNIQS